MLEKNVPGLTVYVGDIGLGYRFKVHDPDGGVRPGALSFNFRGGLIVVIA